MIITHTYLNGEIVPSKQALLPVTDRGLSMGDGLFETISIYNGRIYKWEWHRERLLEGLAALGLMIGVEPLQNAISELLKRCNAVDCLARITITRGEGGAGYLPPVNVRPNIIITLRDFPEALPDSAMLTLSRWRRCGEIGIKTISAIASVMARKEAVDSGCFEALMTSDDGVISECSSANIFWVKNGAIYTPDASTGIIRGIMRRAIIEMLDNKVIEGRYKVPDLLNADEVFITNVAWKIMPVSRFMSSSYSDHATAIKLAGMVKNNIAAECMP